MNFMPLLASGVGYKPKAYIEDVFSAFTYVGGGPSAAITNGLELKNYGGLVWMKSRTSIGSHFLFDTARDLGNSLSTNSTGAQSPNGAVSFPLSTGFTVTASGTGSANEAGQNFVSWSFRRATKFFDVVTFTATGADQRVSHSLGAVPGMIVVKRVNGGQDWPVYHKDIGINGILRLNDLSAVTTLTNIWGTSAPTSTDFGVGSGLTPIAGDTYVAYIFAHDTATDGLIQCGSVTTNASGKASVTLGWEPQFLLVKDKQANQCFQIVDTARSAVTSLEPDAVELYSGTTDIDTNSGGFAINARGFTIAQYASTDYAYLAIRRGPMRQPTSGFQVFNAITRTGSGAPVQLAGVGFPPDLVAINSRSAGGSHESIWFDRLRGPNRELFTSWTDAEYAGDHSTLTAFNMDGVTLGAASNGFGVANISGHSYINWFFRRYPGVFDEVCFTGTGIATAFPHNLKVAPEMIILKNRSSTTNNWLVYHTGVGNTAATAFNTNGVPAVSTNYWVNNNPNSLVFSVGASTSANANGASMVAWLFATLAGISKVFSYTGNGASQTINCNFTNGARFILLRRTDNTGDWLVWDSTRGIVASNDPHLAFNTSAAEVTTDDSIDPDPSGFIVNQLAETNINFINATYIGLAIA